MVSLSDSETGEVYVIVCLYMYMYCRWRSSYQEGDLINWFNPAIFLCMSHAMNLISLKRHISFSLFHVSNELWCEVVVCFVDIGGIVDHHCYLILNNINQRFLKNRLILYFKTLFGRYQLLVGRGRRSRNRMVIGLTPTCAISTYHH